ncbi:uncharacterized protein, partial [Cebidichthys violaceus]|uniref:uncharacterized protein n=1 Tax=Cebidichthys violaceus TaxID=271503 RepID=UPI0035CC3192
MDWISRRSRGVENVRFEGLGIASLLFADDVVLLASSDRDLQHSLGRFAAECEVAGMRVGMECLPQANEFKYLGVLFTSEDKMEREIVRRIGAAAAVKQALHRTILVKRELSRKAKLSIYQSVYVPTLTHGHELWVAATSRNLGVVMDSDLNLNSHIKTITKSAYYHLKNISRIRGLMSQQHLEKLVHAFIFSRLDYCNGVFTGLCKKSTRKLQLIQNAAARVLTKTKKVDHITPVLRSLHWLPVQQRIDFKILLLVYKALNGLGPKYISNLLLPYEPSRPLRSSGTGLLSVPRVRTKHGEAAFSFFAPHIWNKVPESCRSAESLSSFKSRLKTF